MPASLNTLPFDLFHDIVNHLDISDFHSLKHVCKRFSIFLQNESTARNCLQKNAPFSRELQGARQAKEGAKAPFSSALSRLSASQEAFRKAEPYSISILAYTNGFLYAQGVLCYTSGDEIRILNIFSAARKEMVIDLRNLLSYWTWQSDSEVDDFFTGISPVSLADNVLVCLCEIASSESWLLLIEMNRRNNPEQLISDVWCHRICCDTKLWVRHNNSYLYYGTHSVFGSHGHHEWQVQGLNLKTRKPIREKPIQLFDFVGSELGSTACFEIHGNYFHALSNQTSVEEEEVDWTSYYHHVRFSLDDEDPDIRPRKIWRRQHNEGPINDSWTDLSLQKDAKTGELLIVECRKEWLGGGSANIRTYYTQPLNLYANDEPLTHYAYPANDPLTRTLDESSKPNYEPPKKRLLCYAHPEYDAKGMAVSQTPNQDFILAKTKFRSYNCSTMSFVDLVNDPRTRPGSVRLQDRLRLRVASRTKMSPLVPSSKVDPTPEEPNPPLLRERCLDEYGVPIPGSDAKFHPTQIHIWPPDDAPPELFDLLCPGGRAGSVEAASDERSIVYMTGPSPTIPSGLKALVLINFDPTWCHPGLKRRSAFGEVRGVDVVLDVSGCNFVGQNCKRPLNIDLRRQGGGAGPAGKKQKCDSQSSTSASHAPAGSSDLFLSEQDAMYLAINCGYWLR